MQNITQVASVCGTTVTVTNTTTGQIAVVHATIIAALAATVGAPVPLAQVAASYALSQGPVGTPANARANKALRSAVQQLAQPGQYKGSMCLGALASTLIPGASRAQIQWLASAQLRKPLTRNGGNGGAPPVSQAPMAA